MSEIQYFTPEGLEALKKELSDLKHIERPKIVQAIAEARDKGDLSENAGGCGYLYPYRYRCQFMYRYL